MIIKKGNFYVFTYSGEQNLSGYNEKGELVSVSDPTEIIMFYNLDEEMDISDELNPRDATELEKEFWTDAMNNADMNTNFGAVSLSTFNQWKKQKGYE